uniref:hypothetical protein n=1 Tax=Bordetella sputigena TaxID=1416810 RepID=UPI0039F0571A
MRQEHAQPIAQTLHRWLIAQRQRVPDGSPTHGLVAATATSSPGLCACAKDIAR